MGLTLLDFFRFKPDPTLKNENMVNPCTSKNTVYTDSYCIERQD